ncbi:MAG: Fic family protein [Candidatus Cloacimonetes bacterium]|nr:Fic family protein [Candidatus Cloacimonadota bacterium]
MKNRCGIYVAQPSKYRAFIPNPLPPQPPIVYGEELQFLLSNADRTLARLDGVTTVLPNPDLFITMCIKKEALLSSQIEGTQASLEGVLEFEANLKPKEDINEVKEVINYIKAMNYGIERIKEFPISLRLIKELHKVLIKGTRGAHRDPGEFRKTQNWIGPIGAFLKEAVFVPPPSNMVLELMGDMEKFIHRKDNIPPLIKIALIHSQFETIHPFLDGNGRIGRLLITFYLYLEQILSKPLLYLSYYLKKKREKYYSFLMDVRLKGDWESWLKFFLQGVIEVSEEATNTAKEIIGLKEILTKKLFVGKITSIYAVSLLDMLFHKPLISVNDIINELNIYKQTANDLIKKFEKIGILQEITGKQRYRKYLFSNYIEIIKRGTEI